MEKDDFFYLGKILSTHGNSGQLVVFLDVDNPEKYSELESVYVDLDHERVPFFITGIEFRQGKKALVRFEDVNSMDDAEPYCGRKLYLPASMLPKLTGNRFYHHEVTGFTVIDEQHGNIGVIESVLEMPTQSLFQIRFGTKEILVPVTDDILLKVDRRKREIRIDAPPGLIELYL
jgi:16S rRNA processing protein RimM